MVRQETTPLLHRIYPAGWPMELLKCGLSYKVYVFACCLPFIPLVCKFIAFHNFASSYTSIHLYPLPPTSTAATTTTVALQVGWLAGWLDGPFLWPHCQLPGYFSRECLLRSAEILQRL